MHTRCHMGQHESCTEHQVQQDDTASTISEQRYPLCCADVDASGDTCVGLILEDSYSDAGECSPRSNTHGSTGIPPELSVLGMLKPRSNPHKQWTGSQSGSTSSASSSSREREHSGANLRSVVRSFAKEVVSGLLVVLVNPKTATKTQFLLQMDKYLTVFSLRGKNGPQLEPSTQDVNIRDVKSIYKGPGVAQRVPALAGISTHCVGLDAGKPDKSFFFYFDDPIDVNKFYASFKILRISVDMVPIRNTQSG